MHPFRSSHLAIAGALALLTACAALAGVELPKGESGVLSGQQGLHFVIDCPGSPQVQQFPIQNTGTADGEYTVTVKDVEGLDTPPVLLVDANKQLVKELHGAVKAHSTITVQVQAAPVAPVKVSGELTVKLTNNPDSTVPFDVTTNGATLKITPTLVDFGEIRLTDNPTLPIHIENTGSIPAKIEGFKLVDGDGTELAIDLPTTATMIDPGKSIDTFATFAKGGAGPERKATFQPVTGATCGPLPSVTIKGTRVNRQVTVAPTTFDFGEANCNAPATAPQTITLTNYGPVSVTYHVTGLPPTSKFSLSPMEGTIGAGGATPATTTLSVKREQLGPEVGPYTEPNVLITLESGSEQYDPAKVTLSAKSVGAIIDIKPTTIDFGTLVNNSTPTRTLTLTNSGNKFVMLNHSVTNTTGNTFGIPNNGSTTAVYPPGTWFFGLGPPDGDFDVRFNATGNGDFAATLTTVRTGAAFLYPESGVVCNVIPEIPITGKRDIPPQN